MEAYYIVPYKAVENHGVKLSQSINGCRPIEKLDNRDRIPLTGRWVATMLTLFQRELRRPSD